jgi:hypothetical protein
LPGFASNFNDHPAGYVGWNHLYSFGWFFVCTISSIVYFGLSYVGSYAKVERTMSFEALVAEQTEVLDGLSPNESNSQDASEINVEIEKKA